MTTNIWRDLRFGWRMLRKSPAFTMLAIVALGLGIGATTAMYTVIDFVLLRPLHFLNPERLVMLWEVQPSSRINVIQTQNFLDWRERSRSFESMAAILSIPMNLTGIGDPVQVTGLRVSADFFRVLGVPPLLGRTISAEEEELGNPGSVVLSYGLFVQRYGADPGVVGRKISVHGLPLEVVGVMPRGFGLPSLPADLYSPLQLPKSAPQDGRNFRAVARLRNGVSLEAARAEMKEIARQTAQERPQNNTNWSATAIPLLEQTVGGVRKPLTVLFGAVVCLLLIACANVANLMLMRASSRRHEMSVRAALGAARGDLLRQLTIESILLAAIGGVTGIVLANLGIRAVFASAAGNIPLPRIEEIQIDWRVLLFTTAVSLIVGLVFGVLPGFQLRAESLARTLTETGRSVARGQRRVRSVLVSVEVAVALVLVISAGLMIRSFDRLSRIDPGFKGDELLTLRMLLVPSKNRDANRRATIVEDILSRIRAIPQVTAAGSIHMLPMRGSNSGTGYNRSDRPAPPPGSGRGGDLSVISSGYFQAMGIPFIAGRDFEARDSMTAPFVAILNQSAAQMLFPGEDPIGKHVKVAWEREPDAEIIGVVADIHHDSFQNKPSPCLFLPQSQEPNYSVGVIVHSAGNPVLAARAVQEQIRAADPDQGIAEIKTMNDLESDSIASQRMQTLLLSVFAFLALTLAAVGIYGIISYSVLQRYRELGLRLALGATPHSILAFVIREGLLVTSIGIVAGLAAAFNLTRYLQTLLYEITPTDPVVFAWVIPSIVMVAIVACAFPAWRASHIDPGATLRSE